MTRAALALVVLIACADRMPTLARSTPPGGALSQNQEAVARIRALQQRVSAAAPSSPSRVVCMDDTGVWRRVAARQGAPLDCSPVAEAFQVDGLVRKVVIAESSEAGDWSSVAEHYFYPSGAIAFRYERLTSFQGSDPDIPDGPSGPFIVETRTYYDESGEQVREQRTAVFAATGRQVPEARVARPETLRLRSTSDLGE